MPQLKNVLWEAFARRRAAAITTQESASASYRALRPNSTPNTVNEMARDLPKRPEIQRRIAELSRAAERRVVALIASTAPEMTLSEAKAFLAEGIRKPVGHVDENDPHAQEVTTHTTTQGTGKNRRVFTTKKIKSVGKMESMTLLARMNGWMAEAAIAFTFPGFVATVRDVTPTNDAPKLPDPDGAHDLPETSNAREPIDVAIVPA